jgi:methionyl-tRNA formyltransferase
MNKKLIVIGKDRICRKLYHELERCDNYCFVIDKSSDLPRVVRLIRRGILSLSTVWKMFFAELLRDKYPSPKCKTIKTNYELLILARELQITEIYLFRAGLIINKKLLESGISIFNFHCAKIPEYGGLGSIAKALKDKCISQESTLHRVTERIDDGVVIATQPYELNLNSSYRHNENIAYGAGMKLLQNFLHLKCGSTTTFVFTRAEL